MSDERIRLGAGRHYWTRQYGPTETLLGGLVVGSAYDLSATFYNLGALALAVDPRFTFSLDALEIWQIRMPDGAGEDLDFRSRGLELERIAKGGAHRAMPSIFMPRGRATRWMWAAGGLLVGAILTAMGVWTLTRPNDAPRPGPSTRFAIHLPESDSFPSAGSSLAISPDGQTLVYRARRGRVTQLFRRSIDQLEALPIPGTEEATEPFLSPDGKWVGFEADGKLKKVLLAGGPPVTLFELEDEFLGAAWTRSGMMVVAQEGSGLSLLSEGGGIPRLITRLEEGERHHRHPKLLLGEDAVLFGIWYGSLETQRIAIQSLQSGERQVLAEGAKPHYARGGYLTFARKGAIWAVRLDVERWQVAGSPEPLLRDVQSTADAGERFSLAENGTLVYQPKQGPRGRSLVWWTAKARRGR